MIRPDDSTTQTHFSIDLHKNDVWFLLEIVSEVRAYPILDCVDEDDDWRLGEIEALLAEAAYEIMAEQVDALSLNDGGVE